VVVADSLYCNATFLTIFLTVQFIYALVCQTTTRNGHDDN